MSRILIWKKTAPGCEYDIFNSTDYKKLYDHVQNSWGGICKNWGNRLWFQGIYSAIDTGENEYDFITDDINIEKINGTYDKIVLPMANIFYHGFLESLRALTLIFEKIKVPTYVVVCGVQADSYDSLNDVISSIGKESARFIRAIYNTGGEFALRGYFTKEFFDKLGFSSAVVTGCPSMYQLGSKFQIKEEKVEECHIEPVFNGHLKPFSKIIRSFPKSVFIDQDEFFYPLFQTDYLSQTKLRFQTMFVQKYGELAAELLAEGRIIVAADMNDWSNYLAKNNFNYAFGSRIHGTIMALLSGMPATIVTTDSRTREMAEFFDIPYVLTSPKHSFGEKEFYKLYDKMDYSCFNRTFAKKYESYEMFLKNAGIVSNVNERNTFFYDKEPNIYNGSYEQQKKFKDFSETILQNKFRIKADYLKYLVEKRIR